MKSRAKRAIFLAARESDEMGHSILSGRGLRLDPTCCLFGQAAFDCPIFIPAIVNAVKGTLS